MADGFSLGADEGERLAFGEGAVLIRASAESTNGAFGLFEEIPPLLDTPPHVHANEDELIHVVEGEHVFTCGEREFPVGPGGMVYLPRGVPHSQTRVEAGVGRLIVLVTPAGFEGFFRDLAAADREGTLGPDAYAAASEKHGITWLG
jgi:mannose-6-phosphate isomerase-like protein (cupin superfamily)